MSAWWVEDYYAAWNAEDPAAVAGRMTDDVVFEDVTAGHVAHGADQVRRFVEVCNKRVPGVRHEVVGSQSGPDAYTVERVVQPMGLRGSSAGTPRDGRISSNRDYRNGAAFQP